MIVYRVTNEVNGKLYFGITTCPLRVRWANHKYGAVRGGRITHLSLAIRKYGVDNFKIEQVAECSSYEEMYALEIELISKYQTTNRLYGYNKSQGGEKVQKGLKHTEATRKLMSDAQKNRIVKPHTPETIRRMEIACVGRDMSKARAASLAARRGKTSPLAITVNQLTLGGDLVTSHPSIKVAALSVGGIKQGVHDAIHGRLKTYKGFLWQQASPKPPFRFAKKNMKKYMGKYYIVRKVVGKQEYTAHVWDETKLDAVAVGELYKSRKDAQEYVTEYINNILNKNIICTTT